MRSFIILAAVLFCSCAPDPTVEGRPFPTERRDWSLDIWIERGNPVGSCMEHELKLAVVSQDELQYVCHRENGLSYALDGCFYVERQRGAFESHITSTILVDQTLVGYSEFEETVEHELRHYMSWCSGIDEVGEHKDPRVWYTAEIREGWNYE